MTISLPPAKRCKLDNQSNNVVEFEQIELTEGSLKSKCCYSSELQEFYRNHGNDLDIQSKTVIESVILHNANNLREVDTLLDLLASLLRCSNYTSTMLCYFRYFLFILYIITEIRDMVYRSLIIVLLMKWDSQKWDDINIIVQEIEALGIIVLSCPQAHEIAAKLFVRHQKAIQNYLLQSFDCDIQKTGKIITAIYRLLCTCRVYIAADFNWKFFCDFLVDCKFCEAKIPTAYVILEYLKLTDSEIREFLQLHFGNDKKQWEMASCYAFEEKSFMLTEKNNAIEHKNLPVLPGQSISLLTTLFSNIVEIGGVLIPKSNTNTAISCDQFVITEQLEPIVKELALAISSSLPVLLQGAHGVGKTHLISYMAALTGNRLISIHIDDSTDCKSLFGNYICTDTPGKFKYEDGIVTKAIVNGNWLLIEDFETASQDFRIIISKIIESKTVDLSMSGLSTGKYNERFRLFTTVSSDNGSNSCHIDSDWVQINMKPYSSYDMKQLLISRFPNMSNEAFEWLTQIYEWGNSMNDVLKIQLSSREMVKICSRLTLHPNLDYESLDGRMTMLNICIDVLLSHLRNSNQFLSIAYEVGNTLYIPKDRVDMIINGNHVYPVVVNQDLIKIGNSLIEKRIFQKTSDVKLPNFTLTQRSAKLVERILSTIHPNVNEPLLLVGETGTGKTTAVQYVGALFGMKLRVINMSQQSDSSDLIGGFKPVDICLHYISPFREKFDYAFRKTFSVKENQKFVDTCRALYCDKKWKKLCAVWNMGINMAIKKVENNAFAHLKESWKSLEKDFHLLYRQVEFVVGENRSKIAFSFVEGILTQALKKGEWILLDEINLATPETLQCLMGILQSAEGSMILHQRGDEEILKRHPNFRIFACMNPSTDVGKKELPFRIKSKFTEIWVPSIDEEIYIQELNSAYELEIGQDSISYKDLSSLIEYYLKRRGFVPGKELTDFRNKVSEFHLTMRYFGTRKCFTVGSTTESPHYSIRTLSRSLSYGLENPDPSTIICGLSLFYIMPLGTESQNTVKLIMKRIFGTKFNRITCEPKEKIKYDEESVLINGFKITKGHHHSENSREIIQNFILTPSVEENIRNLALAITSNMPILLQGPTSAGKTSMIEYLAALTGNRFVRINNHEHTDIQEYIGSYSWNDTLGKLVFNEGILVKALRNGWWIVLDELNLAPSDVLEALNRLLDDNRELYIAETGETVKPNKGFLLFATQNPAGTVYGGRKFLSKAFRNRFVELHISSLPSKELEVILHKKCDLAPSYSNKLVKIYEDMQKQRSQSHILAGRNGFITIRDLFRWSKREMDGGEQILGEEGFCILAERVRTEEERLLVKNIIEKHLRCKLDMNSAAKIDFTGNLLTTNNIIWTKAMKRLYYLVDKCIKHDEPVLMVGETGCGKTTVVQLLAEIHKRALHMVNCHYNSESSDFIGGLRPCRDNDEPGLFEWKDGPLIAAMKTGSYFLLDEISLAEDSVLERLNSVLEPSRSLMLSEKSENTNLIKGLKGFQFFATMNPGGDFGKKELSPALRNRFTEIWIGNAWQDIEDLKLILNGKLKESIHQEDKNWIIDNIIFLIDWYSRELGYKSLFSADEAAVISLRDLQLWVDFINHSNLERNLAFYHGAMLVLSDLHYFHKKAVVNDIANFQKEFTEIVENISKVKEEREIIVNCQANFVTIGKFSIQKMNYFRSESSNSIHWAPTTKINVMKLVRAMTLPNNRPILLEGSPGVGKTSTVISLSRHLGQKIIRINLSEQTDLMDLFGFDIPDETTPGGKPSFKWRDGPLLQAMQSGYWILLDELNLANQTVLEGLNACLDHRASVYIPDIDKTISCHPNFRIFGAQNPLHQGGGRRGLPQSFLNRFVRIYMDALNYEDMCHIACQEYDHIVSKIWIKNIVLFNMRLSEESAANPKFGIGGNWEFNLRDVYRWLDVLASDIKHNIPTEPGKYLEALYLLRFSSDYDREISTKIFDSIFETPYAHKPLLYNMNPAEFRINSCAVERLKTNCGNLCGSTRNYNSLFLKSHTSQLHALLKCVEHNWAPILCGPSSCGKTSLVRFLASTCNQKLIEINLHSAIDASDLVGSYEQYHSAEILLEIQTLVKDFCIQGLKRLLLTDSRKKYIENCDLFVNLMVLVENCDTLKSNLTEILKIIQSNLDAANSELSEKISRKIQNVGNHDTFFTWKDSPLIGAIENGYWVLIENTNMCSTSVLDRLNSLLEKNGSIHVHEKGEMISIKPHKNFRIFFTMDPNNGDLSRAMRNRGVEICFPSILGPNWEENVKAVLISKDIISGSLFQSICDYVKEHSDSFLSFSSINTILDTYCAAKFNGSTTNVLLLDNLGADKMIGEQHFIQSHSSLSMASFRQGYLKQFQNVKEIVPFAIGLAREGLSDDSVLWLENLINFVYPAGSNGYYDSVICYMIYELKKVLFSFQEETRKTKSSELSYLQLAYLIAENNTSGIQPIIAKFMESSAINLNILEKTYCLLLELTSCDMIACRNSEDFYKRLSILALNTILIKELSSRKHNQPFPYFVLYIIERILNDSCNINGFLSESHSHLKSSLKSSCGSNEFHNFWIKCSSIQLDDTTGFPKDILYDIMNMHNLKILNSELNYMMKVGSVDIPADNNLKVLKIFMNDYKKDWLGLIKFKSVAFAGAVIARNNSCKLQDKEVVASSKQNLVVYLDEVSLNNRDFISDELKIVNELSSLFETDKKTERIWELNKDTENAIQPLKLVGIAWTSLAKNIVQKFIPASSLDPILRPYSEKIVYKNMISMCNAEKAAMKSFYKIILGSTTDKHSSTFPFLQANSEFEVQLRNSVSSDSENITAERSNEIFSIVLREFWACWKSVISFVEKISLENNFSIDLISAEHIIQEKIISWTSKCQEYSEFHDIFFTLAVPMFSLSRGIRLYLCGLKAEFEKSKLDVAHSLAIGLVPSMLQNCDYGSMNDPICHIKLLGKKSSVLRGIITCDDMIVLDNLFRTIAQQITHSEESENEEKARKESVFVYKNEENVGDNEREMEDNYYCEWENLDDVIMDDPGKRNEIGCDFKKDVARIFLQIFKTEPNDSEGNELDLIIDEIFALIDGGVFFDSSFDKKAFDMTKKLLTDNRTCCDSIIEVGSVLNDVKLCVGALLDEFPDHPILVDLKKIYTRILTFNMNESITKFMVGLDILVSKAHEWEAIAARHVSLDKNIKEMEALLFAWKREELRKWKGRLETERIKAAEKALYFWPHLFVNTSKNTINELDTHRIMKTINEFIITSPVGEFERRLQMIDCAANNNFAISYSGSIYSCLRNIYTFYNQFTNVVSEWILNKSKKIEKSIDDQLKILAWKQNDWTSFKVHYQKSNIIICKHMKEYRQLLNTSITDIISEYHESENARHRTRFTDQPNEERESTESIDILYNMDSYDKESLIFKVIRRIRKLCETFRSSLSPKLYESFFWLIINSISELNLEKSDVSPNEKKVLLKIRQNFLVDLLKELKEIGLRYKKGRILNRMDLISGSFVINNLLERNMSLQVSGYTRKINGYSMKTVSRYEVLEKLVPNASDQLAADQVMRSFSMTSDMINRVFKMKDLVFTWIDGVERIKLYVKFIFQRLENTETQKLYNSGSQRCCTLRHIVFDLIQIVSHHKSLNLLKWNDVWVKTNALFQKLEEVFGLKYQTLPAIVLIPENDLEEMEADTRDLIDEIRKINHQLLPDYFFKFFKKSDSDTISADIIQEKDLEYWKRFVMLAIQNVAKILQSQDVNKNGLGTDEITAQEINKALNIREALNTIDQRIQKLKFFDSVELSSLECWSEYGDFISCYLQLCEQIVVKMLHKIASLSKFNYLLVNIFISLYKNGFCLPNDSESDDGNNDGDNCDELEGTGMDDGQGRNDVSQEIEDEEQILGLQDQEEDSSPPPTNEAADNGIEMEKDFEGKLDNTPEDTFEEEDENGNDDEEIENQMGDLDNNSSQDIDTKFWESDNNDDSEEEEEDECNDAENNAEGLSAAQEDVIAAADDSLDTNNEKSDNKEVTHNSDEFENPDNSEDDSKEESPESEDYKSVEDPKENENAQDLCSNENDDMELSDDDLSEQENIENAPVEENPDDLKDENCEKDEDDDDENINMESKDIGEDASGTDGTLNAPMPDKTENHYTDSCTMDTEMNNGLVELSCRQNNYNHLTQNLQEKELNKDDLAEETRNFIGKLENLHCSELVSNNYCDINENMDYAIDEETSNYSHTGLFNSDVNNNKNFEEISIDNPKSSQSKRNEIIKIGPPEDFGDRKSTPMANEENERNSSQRKDQVNYNKESIETETEFLPGSKQLNRQTTMDESNCQTILPEVQDEICESFFEKSWKLYSDSTHDMAMKLCERLRLILEPTKANKLKGGYKSGKRLDLKKIIPYIASNYRKDRIWMRRTKPSSRDYKVLVAIDDSKSMKESGAVETALKCIALVTKSFSQLEVGEVGIVRFGTEIHVAHDFGTAFTREHGAKMIEDFSFSQSNTDILQLMKYSLFIFDKLSSVSSNEPWKLEIIISDGICDNHASIKQMVREAYEKRILILFIIIDTAAENSKLTKTKNVKFIDGKLVMEDYMDSFPFEFFITLENVEKLPDIFADALKQWFELVNE